MSIVKKIIENVNKIVTLTVTSDVKLKGGKSNPMVGRVTKQSIVNVRILGNGEYERVVNEKVDREFKSGSRAWGTRTKDGLIEHNGNLYVEVEILMPISRKFLLDGKEINKDKLIGFEEKERTEAVIVCSYKIDNIKAMMTDSGTFVG